MIGIICMVLAVAITFLITPIVNKITGDTLNVYGIANDIKQGAQITEANVKVIGVRKDSLPQGAISDKSKIVGMYAISNLYAGDVYTSSKLTNNPNTASDVFATLDGSQVAMSFTIDTFAAGLSGKLENGDIISIIVSDKDTGKTVIPSALKYVKVITTTTSGGIDKEMVVANDDGSFELPSTVTVIVSTEQAKILAGYEKDATMQVALVYRGDKETAQKFLNTQNEYLKKGATDNDSTNTSGGNQAENNTHEESTESSEG